MIWRDSLLRWIVVSVLFGESQGLAVGPDRLDACLDDTGKQVTFRVFSCRATRVEVLVYNHPIGETEKAKLEMNVDPATKIWSKTATVADPSAAGVCATIHYGYRVWGPNWPFDTTFKFRPRSVLVLIEN